MFVKHFLSSMVVVASCALFPISQSMYAIRKFHLLMLYLTNVIYETLQVQVFVAIIQSFPLDKLNCETTSIAQYHTITLYNYIKLKEAPFYVDLSHIGPILLSNWGCKVRLHVGTGIVFFKMGQTRPLFCLFSFFSHIAWTNIAQIWL